MTGCIGAPPSPSPQHTDRTEALKVQEGRSLRFSHHNS